MARLLLLMISLVACHTTDAFECLASSQCRDGAQAGTCEPTGFCSFDDAACASGRRYDPSADPDLAGQCVEIGDRDHDGILDNLDNCPTMFNPAQDNEDGDALGDACDPCPAFADPSPPLDPDNDGVSGSCDSDQTALNHIALFEGFHKGIPALWAPTGSAIGDMDAVGFDGDARATVMAPTLAGTTVAYTVVNLKTLGLGGGQVGITMLNVYCNLEETAAGLNQQLVIRKDNQGTIATAAFSFTATKYYLVLARTPSTGDWQCYANNGTDQMMITGNKPAGFSQAIGVVNVGTIAGNFEQFMIVTE